LELCLAHERTGRRSLRGRAADKCRAEAERTNKDRDCPRECQRAHISPRHCLYGYFVVDHDTTGWPPRNSMKRWRTRMGRCRRKYCTGPGRASGRIHERISGSNMDCWNRMRTRGKPGLTIPLTRFPSGTWMTRLHRAHAALAWKRGGRLELAVRHCPV